MKRKIFMIVALLLIIGFEVKALNSDVEVREIEVVHLEPTYTWIEGQPGEARVEGPEELEIVIPD